MQHGLDLLKTQERSLLHYIDGNNDLFIIGMKSLKYLKARGEYNQVLDPLHITAQWSSDFLCNPHVDLGRKGAVCPFTKPSIDKELFWLSLYLQPAPQSGDIKKAMIKYRDLFFQLAPQTGREAQYKTILVVFPQFQEKECKELIDKVQQELKPDFVSSGLMIGQFYASCPESGLWNPAFRPLQSPLPMLVIRNMVISDYPFLEYDKDLVQSWASQFPHSHESYLSKYKSAV